MSTIEEHCCGADSMFDAKTARKQYQQYLKKGPSKVTARMIEQLSAYVDFDRDKSMIDVGGGIGALQWWFLESGGKKTTSVDASSSYIARTREHAEKNDWQDQTHFIMGDIAELDNDIGEADVITMDKVVCCYPDYKSIIKTCRDRSRSLVSLSFPMDGFVAKVISDIGALFIRFKTKNFRPYVHPVAGIRDEFLDNGFVRVDHSLSFPWHIETYQRINSIE